MQALLLNEMGKLIRAFAEEETREVAAAVAGARDQLSTGAATVSSGFENVHTHATSLATALQVGGASFCSWASRHGSDMSCP